MSRLAFGFGFMLLLAVAGAAMAESRVRIVIISLVQHSVEVNVPPRSGAVGAGRWTPALMNAPVIEGESIRTEPNGVAEVELECGSALRLTPSSEMEFNRLRLSDQGVPFTAVTLGGGEAYFSMQDADSRDFHLRIGAAELSLPSGGATLRLDVPHGKPASIEVLNGQVVLQDGRNVTAVKSSRRIELLPGGGLRTLALEAADAWQKWSHHRDQLFERAVLASGPKPPLQDAASALPPIYTVPTPPAPNSEQLQSVFRDLDKSHPDTVAPVAAPAAPVPHCAHR
ncbi:MAG: FecR domain-containing protein [Terriglobales bacterium]